MNKIVVSVGSNSNDSVERMSQCLLWLSGELEAFKASSVYKTPAINGKDSDYLNAVACGYTEMNFDEFNAIIKQYERDNGRTAMSKIIGVIPLDVDVVLWNDIVKRESDYNRDYFQIGWNELKDNML